MFGWLGSIIGWSVSGVDDLWHKVVQVIQAVYGWAANEVDQAIADINSVYQWAYNTVISIEKWVGNEYNVLYSFANAIYNKLTSWIRSLVASVYGYARAILSWAGQQIARIYAYLQSLPGQIVAWVLQNIWNPLYGLISGAFRWIARYGAWTVYMLTHPDQLAALLGRYILASWGQISHRYAGQVGRWLIHSMLSMTEDIAGILEDIIAGIL